MSDIDALDNDGYPTDEALETLRTWDCRDPKGAIRLLAEIFEGSGSGKYQEERHENDIGTSKTRHIFVSGGWSGNEEAIAALQDNFVIWAMYWYSSTRGGKWEFELPNISAKADS